MDPILIKAIREFRQQMERVSKSGVTVTPEQQEEFFRVKTEGKYGVADAQKVLASIDSGVTPRNLGRSMIQGPLFNWGDELLGLVPEALGGGEGAKEEMRLREDLYRKDHKAVDILGSILGTLIAARAAPGALGASSTLAGTAARGAALGAGSGALAGAGMGEEGDRSSGAIMGGVAGGAAGAVLSSLFRGAKLTNPAARADARLSGAMQKSGGTAALLERLRGFKGAGRGDEVMLGDLSDHLRMQTDFAANSSDDVFVPLAQKVRGRQADASDRLVNDVRDLAGDADAATRRAELEGTRRQWASSDEGFEGLRKANTDLDRSGDLAAVLKQPKVARALADAKEAGLIGKVPEKRSQLSFEKLQSVKQDLDDAVGAAFRQGKGNLGSRLKEARDILVEELEARVPGYVEKNAKYKGMMNLERALEAGEEAWDVVDTRGLSKQVAALGPEELDLFRYGLASKMIAKLRSTATNRDEAKRILEGSSALKDKLKIVFGDKKTFDEFMERVSIESDLAKMKGPLGNSASVRRLQSAGMDPAELGLTIATDPASGLLAAGGKALLRNTRGAAQRGTARALGPKLMLQGNDAIERLLRSWEVDPAKFGNPFFERDLPIAASGLLSRFGR